MNPYTNIVAMWSENILHVMRCRARGEGCTPFCYLWWHQPLSRHDLNVLFPMQTLEEEDYEDYP